jgi:hypothetical protein
MNVDATLDALLADASSSFRSLLRRAYELGYREALAHARPLAVNGAPAPPVAAVAASPDEDDLEPLPDEASAPEIVVAPEDVEPSTPVAGEGPEQLVEAAPVARFDWTELDEGGGGGKVARSRETGRGRIFPHATIGTLRQRIIDYFELERFDIDVIVCRKGDRARRQLKASVKLSKYEVEG